MKTLRELIDALDATDPEDVAAVHRVVSAAFVAGFRGFYREASAHSPAFAQEWAGVSSRGGTTTVTQRRRRCLDCGMVTVPGCLAQHQNAKGHSGWEYVR